METPRWECSKWLATVALLAGLVGSTSAQIVQLSGSVTAVAGLYVGGIAVGAPVSVQLDLTAPLVDLYPNDPIWGKYIDRPMTFLCNGEAYPVDIWPNEVAIINRAGGWLSGLNVSAVWSMETPSAVVFGLVGETDRITCDSNFPAGIPMDSFFYHEGEYFSPVGRIAWSIDAYDVFRSSPDGVPEPGFYGIGGAVWLSIMAGGRRFGWGRRG